MNRITNEQREAIVRKAVAERDSVLAGAPQKLWLWKNFVDGKPEYWAFDNAYPINLDNGDPQTLGEPCGYAIFKPSRQGRTDVSEEQVLRAVARARPVVAMSDERYLLGQIIDSLPQNKDWLDPSIERAARRVLAAPAPLTQAAVDVMVERERPFIHATIDRASGLHELWIAQMQNGMTNFVAGPAPWPRGWAEIFHGAEIERLDRAAGGKRG